MTALCDLHTHTTASDGQYTPAELAWLAKNCGLSVLAVTDHDTIAGVEEARQAGAELGLTVIRGVELSARNYPNCQSWATASGMGTPNWLSCASGFGRAGLGRDERKHKIVAFLRERGVEIDLAEVEELASGDVMARPHFARVMVVHGYVASNREAFDRYLGTEEFRQKVKRFKADARTCLETIKSAGGKVSLAHPYQMGLPDSELEALVAQLKGWGLDAIECDYPKYTPKQQAFYLHLAEK